MKNISSYAQLLAESLKPGKIWAVQADDHIYFYDSELAAQRSYVESVEEEAYEAWQKELGNYEPGELRDEDRYDAEMEAFMRDYTPEDTYMLDAFDLSDPDDYAIEDIVEAIKNLKDIDALLELAEAGLDLKIYFEDPQELLDMIDQRADMREKMYGKEKVIGRYWTGQEKEKKKEKQKEKLKKFWPDVNRYIKSGRLFGI